MVVFLESYEVEVGWVRFRGGREKEKEREREIKRERGRGNDCCKTKYSSAPLSI
jgi:hypothetical protein